MKFRNAEYNCDLNITLLDNSVILQCFEELVGISDEILQNMIEISALFVKFDEIAQNLAERESKRIE